TRVLGRSRRPVSESPPGRLAQGPLALVRAPDDQADNEEDNEEERAAPVEEDVEVARPALWSRLAGMAHHPAEVDNIGRQDEPTDPEPRAQGHEAIFARSGQLFHLGGVLSPDLRVGLWPSTA